MRTRHVKYDISRSETKKLKLICRGNDEIREELHDAAWETYPGIARYLIDSIYKGTSYDTMCKREQIPINIGDFYAYRRKCLSILKDKLITSGKYG